MCGLGEECGLFGIYNREGGCAQDAYYGLMSLQHRGQESCGIAVNENRDITHYKDNGLVNEVFSEDRLEALKGTMAVGHVRYGTAGGQKRENAQPLVLNYVKGNLAIAHNGNLVNADELKKEYERTGAIYQTSSDTEVIAYTIARQRLNCHNIETAISKSMSILRGAYSLVVMSPQKLIAARDPWGFRPLCFGRKGDAIVFASESCGLDAVDAVFERDLEPGEVIVVEDGKMSSIRDNCGGKSHLCIFEYIYFARQDSIICGQFVNEARRIAGMYLAKEHPVDADIVIGVPDSGIPSGFGYAAESGIRYSEGFAKNRYVTRTFIRPNQASRERAIKAKLNPLKEYISGKRVVMVDDSIVRGTTTKHIVGLLKDVGAKEVHVRISAPPFMNPCYFGTDIPSSKELVATHYSVKETAKLINADSLGYLSLESLHKIAPNAKTGFCDACLTGNYPVNK